MCSLHWGRVPQGIRDTIWREYFFGKRHDTHPTPEYVRSVRAAVASLKETSPVA